MTDKKPTTPQPRAAALPIGKLPPQAPEIEEAILGAILTERAAFERVPMLTPAMFYAPENQEIFAAVAALHRAGKPIDILTVTEQLRADGKLDSVGGPYHIAQLSSRVATSAHLEEHALLIQQKYLRRKAIELTAAIQHQAYDEFDDIGDILYHASRHIEDMQEDLIGKSDIQSIADITPCAWDDIERRIDLYQQGEQTGVTTGLCDLNHITSGWQKSELIVIAARPAMGKTALALHFAKAAAKANTPVAIFSLEMSKISLYNRLLLSECDIIPEALRQGNITEPDYPKINAGIDNLYTLPIFVDDNACMTMNHIRSKCRLLKKRGKCGLVIIDYLQLVSAVKDRNANREQEISAMSREAKLIAKELDIPVLLLAQLSRKVEERADKKPMLSDLRESGAIEQDADMVIFIYRPEYYNLTDPAGNPLRNEGKLLISKNRNGKTGDVKFRYNDSLTKIYDYDPRNYATYAPQQNRYH